MRSIDFSGEERVPSKVVCVGRNYVDHIAELGNEVPKDMVLFFKSNASISQALQASQGEPLHYEGEICLGVESGEFRYVGFGLDLTKRELQSELKRKGLPWERCKAFRGSAVLSPMLRIEEGIDELELELRIDGELAQQGGVADMIYKPREIFEEIQAFVDLEDHDIVMTGTPKGVGVIKEGAVYEGTILRRGELLLRHTWRAEA